MKQYISKSKDIIDHLLDASDTLSDKEHMIYVLGGLDANYTSLVTNIISKERILSLDEIYTRMRLHKRRNARMISCSGQLYKII